MDRTSTNQSNETGDAALSDEIIILLNKIFKFSLLF